MSKPKFVKVDQLDLADAVERTRNRVALVAEILGQGDFVALSIQATDALVMNLSEAEDELAAISARLTQQVAA